MKGHRQGAQYGRRFREGRTSGLSGSLALFKHRLYVGQPPHLSWLETSPGLKQNLPPWKIPPPGQTRQISHTGLRIKSLSTCSSPARSENQQCQVLKYQLRLDSRPSRPGDGEGCSMHSGPFRPHACHPSHLFSRTDSAPTVPPGTGGPRTLPLARTVQVSQA